MNKKQFITAINQTPAHEWVYINAINLKIPAIDTLREYIRSGVLIPNLDELKKMIKPDAISKFLSGECIAPQLTYKKGATT